MSIENAYNAWAKQYDTNTNKTRDLDAQSTVSTLNKYPFKRVLELGCGTGKNTQWLIQKAERVIGLDFSNEMLQIAKAKIPNEKVSFQKADLNKTWEKIHDQSVDLITSSLVLEHIADLDHIFEQANKKLIEHGLFFISELHPYRQYQGSRAKFDTESGTVKLEAYTHHISDFTENAKRHGFQLIEIGEWFDNRETKKPPRLISFVFKKHNH